MRRFPGATRIAEQLAPRVVPLIMIVLGAIYYFNVRHLRQIDLMLVQPALVILLISAIWLLIRPQKTAKPEAQEPEGEQASAEAPASGSMPWLLMGLVVVYAAAFNPLGFPIATIGFLMLALVLLGVRRFWLILLIPVATTAITMYVFAGLLNVPIPMGPLSDFFDGF